ncbi:MAG: hypothetical protein RDV41_10605, partial [Planctomycetota bacterium]|nr:hypothetical protein [Planctomycetota bacterium]
MRLPNVGGRATTRVVAVSIGASSLIAQTVLIRELLVAFCGNEISIGIVFAGWMLWVAAGSWIGGFVRPSVRAYLVSALLFAAVCPVTLHAIRLSRELVGAAGVQYLSLPQIMVVALGVLCPMCVIVGIRFPMVVGLSELAHPQTRKSAGTVYALESVGAIVGGVVMTCVLQPFLNSLEIVLLAGGISLIPALPLLAVSSLLRPGTAGRPAGGAGEAATGTGEETMHVAGRGRVGLGYVDAVLGALAVVACVGIGVVVIIFGERLDLASTRAQWRVFNPKLELVERRESRYQNIAVLEYAGQRNIYGSGWLMFSVVDEKKLDPEVEESSNIAFAHLAMTEHRDPRSVLLIGGGATGVLREVLKHPVTRVDYVEFDFVLLEVTKRLLPEADKAALADPRVTVHEMDGRRFVSLAQRGSYDLVVASLPDPTTLGVNRLFTAEFYEGVARALKPDGVFATGMTSAYSPTGVLLDANAAVYHTLREVFGCVMFVPGEHGTFFASNSEGQILYKPETLVERFVARGVACSPDAFRPEVFYLWIEEDQILWTTFLLNRHGRDSGRRSGATPGALESVEAEAHDEITTLTVGRFPLGGGKAIESAELDRDRFINSDSSPRAVVYSLLVWSRFANPGRRDMLDWLLNVELWWLGPAAGAVLLFCLGAGVVGRCARRRMRPPLSLAEPQRSPDEVGGEGGGEDGRAVKGAHPYLLIIAPRRVGLFVLAASCGFSGMAVQIVLLLAFQNVIGHVYSMIGALVAAFMAGMVVGAVLGQRLSTQLAARLPLPLAEPQRSPDEVAGEGGG